MENPDIRLITADDAEFPANLRLIPGCPTQLYALGNTALLKESLAVAVVGTQDPGDEAVEACRRLTTALTARGFVIVSGLAAGCDTAAHEACLEAGGGTIAVLAHGLDRCYPRENLALRDAILKKGGLLLSEYPVGTEPLRQYFVIRDRIQSGLSRGVIVIETGESGGTMHTVRFAQKQGRLIGCLPCRAAGNRKLLAEKTALPLGCADEIEAFIEMMKAADPKPAVSKQPELF
jgi:DNA processing protein